MLLFRHVKVDDIYNGITEMLYLIDMFSLDGPIVTAGVLNIQKKIVKQVIEKCLWPCPSFLGIFHPPLFS